MSETQGMVDETLEGSASPDGIEASGDAIVIADAIANGLGAIADGMRLIAKALAGSEEEPQDDSEFYLDGSRK